MSTERTGESYKLPIAVGSPHPVPEERQDKQAAAKSTSSSQGSGAVSNASRDDGKPQEATVIVRGEAVRTPDQKSASKDKEKSPAKPVSEAKVKLQNRLPALDDDGAVGVQIQQVVVRDGKPDLEFTGTLVASAAPSTALTGKWEEYRIYTTDGGKRVFSKVTRSIVAEEEDTHEAEVFDPSPSSMPAQLIRSARDFARSEPLTWRDAAVSFFGYGPLAKALYRKFGTQFEEHIK
jgi:hypothetical protein